MQTRETIQQAAKALLKAPVGTVRTVSINTADGLTGIPAGLPPRFARMKDNELRVDEQERDGKKRVVVTLVAKGTVLANGAWT